MTPPSVQIQRIRAYRSDPKITRAQLAALLNFSWTWVDRIFGPSFLQEGANLVIPLSAVEKYYESILQKRVQKTISQLTAAPRPQRQLRAPRPVSRVPRPARSARSRVR